MSTPRVTRIVISTAPARPKPRAGDTKVIRGVLHVRRIARCKDGPYKGAMIVNNGRTVWEWVPAQKEGDAT